MIKLEEALNECIKLTPFQNAKLKEFFENYSKVGESEVIHINEIKSIIDFVTIQSLDNADNR